MKRIICLLLLLCYVFSLCACGARVGTPFDKLADLPDKKTIIKRLGEPDEISFNSRGMADLDYYDYSWNGYHGYLSIALKDISGNDYYKEVVSAANFYIPVVSKEEADNIIKIMTDVYSKSFYSDGDIYTPIFTDSKGNKYFTPDFYERGPTDLGIKGPYLRCLFWSWED